MFHKTSAVVSKGYNQNGGWANDLHNQFLSTEFFEHLYFNIISLFTMS